MYWIRRVRRFLGWLPIIWRDHSWDYAYLWPILERKFALMEETIRANEFFVGWEEMADELREAKLLCRRLHRDEYWQHPKYVGWKIGGEWYDQSQTDIDRLLHLMRRKLRTWWD